MRRQFRQQELLDHKSVAEKKEEIKYIDTDNLKSPGAQSQVLWRIVSDATSSKLLDPCLIAAAKGRNIAVKLEMDRFSNCTVKNRQYLALKMN